MKSTEVAKAGLNRAERWLQGAVRAFEDKRWDDVVYSSQMTLELSTKAILMLFGIDYPKEHDVSSVLVQLADREDIPKWFKDKVPSISDAVAELAELRGLAGYGFEPGMDAEYFKDYAPEALKRARETFEHCSRLLEELLKFSDVKHSNVTKSYSTPFKSWIGWIMKRFRGPFHHKLMHGD